METGGSAVRNQPVAHWMSAGQEEKRLRGYPEAVPIKGIWGFFSIK
jgi:hypothetical protein